MTRDLTSGSVWKHIIILAISMTLGNAIQQLYSMVDTVIVGQVLGEQPLAGVGSTASLNFMIVFFCMGICAGCGIPVAREFGAGNYASLRKYVTNSVWVCAAFCVVITVLSCIFCGTFLRWLSTPDEIFAYARDYIFVIFIGLACTFFYNLLASVIRGLGDAKTPLIALVISSVVNIGLDFAFMLWIPMGVAGAALATVIAQGLSGLYCFMVLKRKFDILKMQPGEWKLNKIVVKSLCKLGVPMGFQYSITAIGLLVVQSAINGFGTAAVSGMSVANKVRLLIACPLDAIGQIMTPFAGQNLGAGQFKRIKEGLWKTTLLGLGWSVLITIPFTLIAGRSIVGIFLSDPSADIIEYAYTYLMCTNLFNIFLTLVNVFRFTIQGMGYTGLSMISGVMETVGRAFAGIVLANVMGYEGAALGSSLAWILADCFLVPAFFICYKKVSSRGEAAVSKQ